MKVARRSIVLLAMSGVCDMDVRSIITDDQSRVPTTILQPLQTDEGSIRAGNLPIIVKSMFVYTDIIAMISGGITQMNGL